MNSLKSKVALPLIAVGLMMVSPVSAQTVTETMTDRCSGDVVMTADYNSPFPPDKGFIFQTRTNNVDASGYTPWSNWLPVNGHVWVRWFCHSTTGNFFDPGTWSVDKVGVITKCSCDIGSPGCAQSCKVKPQLGIDFSGSGGWTAERSRCSKSSTHHVSMRLGPNRLLQTRCIKE